MTRARTIRTLAAIGATTVLLATACGGDDAGSRPRTAASTDSAEVASTTSAPPDPVEMAAFQRDVAEQCGAATNTLAAIPPEEGTATGVAAQLEILTELEQSSAFDELTVPDELAPGFDQVVDAGTAASASLAQAVEDAEAGDVASAQQNIDRHLSHLSSMDGAFAIIGARCFMGDPARAAGADLNVPLDLGAAHLNTGFGSVWVSQFHGGNVVRVDPVTGEVLATVDVGDSPRRLQPADGRMWVRTEDAFVAIDPETNTVTDRLAKSDVGPDVNRNWALDGTMWICDGRRLHRYDPTTVEPVAVIDLPIDCDYVYEESGLAVAWRYNEDPGESGTSAAVMIDPGTNEVLATVDLPVDVLAPAVLDDAVFFPGYGGPTAVVIDRATWKVSSTVDLPRATGGGAVVTDGERIYVPTHDEEASDVLVIDAQTYDVVETIHPLAVNSVALRDGSLWVSHEQMNVLQRFDLAT